MESTRFRLGRLEIEIITISCIFVDHFVRHVIHHHYTSMRRYTIVVLLTISLFCAQLSEQPKNYTIKNDNDIRYQHQILSMQ